MKKLTTKPYEAFLGFGWAACFFQGGMPIVICWACCMAITLLAMAIADRTRHRRKA